MSQLGSLCGLTFIKAFKTRPLSLLSVQQSPKLAKLLVSASTPQALAHLSEESNISKQAPTCLMQQTETECHIRNP